MPTTESVEYTFENQNLSGVGVFNGEVDNLVGFRGIVSESVALTVALDAPNNVIVLDFDDSQLIAAIPDATTTQRGILETATDAEAIAKALNNKILTPSNLAALGGTTSFAGFLELATNAEAIAGVSTTLAVTPAGLAAAGALNGTVTFADAVARAAAVPAFKGQFGTQLDTDTAYVSYGTSAGEWYPILTLNSGSTKLSVSSALNLDGFGFTITSGNLIIDGTTGTTWTGPLAFNNSTVTLTAATTLDYVSAIVKIAGTEIPANSVFVTSGTPGDPSSRLLNTFLSTANTQTYGIPSGTLARTTFTSYGGQTVSNPPTQAEVQIIDDALVIVSRRLAALITDLIVTLKPTA